MLCSMVNSKEGSRIKLASMAANSVMEVNNPKAKVPPKLDRQKIPNPNNKMIDV